MSSGCKVSNTLIVFKDAKVKARGVKALMARVNSLPYFKAKLHPSQHKGGGAIRVKSKSIKAENAPTT
jgi:hypothetical protein